MSAEDLCIEFNYNVNSLFKLRGKILTIVLHEQSYEVRRELLKLCLKISDAIKISKDMKPNKKEWNNNFNSGRDPRDDDDNGSDIDPDPNGSAVIIGDSKKNNEEYTYYNGPLNNELKRKLKKLTRVPVRTRQQEIIGMQREEGLVSDPLDVSNSPMLSDSLQYR